MSDNDSIKSAQDSTQQDSAPSQAPKPKRRHLIRNAWIRRPLKVLGCLIIFILLIPVLLYLPPVQDALVSVASKIVADQTGMKVDIDRFRLKFPVDISLQGVKVIEASGDTMVMAKEAIADVKLAPLLALDFQINKLRLIDGYYRMVSPDSSMIMKIRAGLVDVDDKSSADMRTSTISLNDATIKDGDVSLFMDVWKQQTTPKDTTSTPFLITAKKLNLENITFAMSMLPTIDTLRFNARNLSLADGEINLRTNTMRLGTILASDGSALMLTPTPEYIKNNPAPAPDTTAAPTPPTTILADHIALSGFDARYAVKDAPAVEGFNASDIRVTGLNIAIDKFFNRATEITLPIKSVQAMEQCGLAITQGSGTFSMDSTGMRLQDFDIRTPASSIKATAAIPNALMEMSPDALLDVDLTASLGMNDINAFMPDLRQYTRSLPAATPLNATVKAGGTLGNAEIERLDVALPGILSLRANGNARNALDLKKLIADVNFDGELRNPSIIDKFVAIQGIDIPTFTIKGRAKANAENYSADVNLLTPHGSLVADGHVGMNSEKYDADVNLHNVNVGAFIGDKTIGKITARLKATGAGFNPEKSGAHTDVNLHVNEAWYNSHQLTDITALIGLQGGGFTIDANSPAPLLNFNIAGRGTIAEDDYALDLVADLRNVDLQALGLSETPNAGHAKIAVKGTASPRRWLYDADLDLSGVEWNLGDQEIRIPEGLQAHLKSTDDLTLCQLLGRGTSVKFTAPSGLKPVVDGFMAAANTLPEFISKKSVNVALLDSIMPRFDLTATVQGDGLADELLAPSGIRFGNLDLRLAKDSVINGDLALSTLDTGSMTLDTITADLRTRNQLFDYNVHVGNRPGTFDEFAQVNLSGYMGENRLSAYLVQHNIKGEQGYRLGFTASVADTVMSIRFTPLKATIAYLPWKFNMDNYIDYCLTDRRVDANLQASSAESSILLKTEPFGDGTDELHLNLTNIHVEDFLQMVMNAPPVTASVNSDMRIRYTGKALLGKGSLNISDLTYDKMKVGNFDFNLMAGTGFGEGSRSGAKIGLLVNGRDAADASILLVQDTVSGKGLVPEDIKLALNRFPLDIANPFLGPDFMKLSGYLNGEMKAGGSLTAPILNGQISCDSVGVFLNMLGTTLKFDNEPLTVTDNVINFNQYDIYAVNSNPLTINGTVDAKKFSSILFDLTAKASNMQLVGNNSRSAQFNGKLFTDLDASVKGPMQFMDINAKLNVLPTTDVIYTMDMTPAEMQSGTGADGVVRFVNFNDTTQVEKADSLTSTLAMRITAQAVISQGAQVKVNLGGDGVVECNPSGTLNYFQNYMGDMRLNGTLYTGTGYGRYKVPVLGNKSFNFDQSSHITWNGDILNPTLAIKATDNVKANIQMNGNTQLVNFLVTLNVSNTLSAPSVLFDLSTDDDISISNELQSMTPDQRSQQAMSLLLTGIYSGNNAKTVNGNMVSGQLFSMLSSQLNNLAGKYVKGVDLSLGVDQYETGANGNTSTTTSYSYQVSKSLINNRFKIIVGGNYSTDASADENFSQNLISDVAFEYILRQTNNMSLSAKLFRHTGFESVLEGEITETGVGLSLRRRLAYFTEILHFGLSKYWKKKPKSPVPAAADSILIPKEAIKEDGLDAGKGAEL